jgi:YfiH family protein
MTVYSDSKVNILFGDSGTSIAQLNYAHFPEQQIAKEQSFQSVCKNFGLTSMAFLKQTHSAHGVIVSNYSYTSFADQGDYLITFLSCNGIGVLTADCLPVVAIDRSRSVVGIAHAGWKGALAGVVEAMIARMVDTYGMNVDSMEFFLGPCAQVCCYQVGSDFVDRVKDAPHTLIERNGAYFFNLKEYVVHRLAQLSISLAAINTSYSICTMCNKSFCSHRRDFVNGGQEATKMTRRQMTVVSLK